MMSDCEPKIQSTTSARGGNLDNYIGPGGIASFSNDYYRQLLSQHRKRKRDEPVNIYIRMTSFHISYTYFHNFLSRLGSS